MSRKRNIFCFWRGKVSRNSFPTGSYPKNIWLEITNAWLETWFAERSSHRNSAHTWSGKLVYLQMSVFFPAEMKEKNNKSNMILSKRMTWDLVSRAQLTFWQTGRKGIYHITLYELSPGNQVSSSSCMHLLFSCLHFLLRSCWKISKGYVHYMSKQTCVIWYFWYLHVLIIPVWTEWVLVWTQVSNCACIICLIRLHSLACQTKFVSIRIQFYNN
jgi:hypothetical protein